MGYIIIINIYLVFTYSPSLQSPNVENQALNQFGNEAVRYDGTSDMNNEKESGLQEMLKDVSSKWPMGIVQYYLDIRRYDFIVAHKIRMCMNIIETNSCIQFIPLLILPNTTMNSSWIHITNPKHERECVHEPLYKNNGEIVLVLGYDCLTKAEILHSLLHGIGFEDEVKHPLRDKYIRVLWHNIQPAYQYLYSMDFGVKSNKVLVEYDPLSVMHFADHDFSTNGGATVEPLVSGMIISPSETLSQLDKLKLNLLFGQVCNKREVKKILQTCGNSLHKKGGRPNKDKTKDKKKGEINNIDGKDSQDVDISAESEQKSGEDKSESECNEDVEE